MAEGHPRPNHMPKMGMEAILVTARLDPQGVIYPLQFTWGAASYSVIGVGRRWQDETGQHMLVMVPGDRVYELVYVPDERIWFLLQPHAPYTAKI